VVTRQLQVKRRTGTLAGEMTTFHHRATQPTDHGYCFADLDPKPVDMVNLSYLQFEAMWEDLL